MIATLPFQSLLERAEARPGRYGRKWHCPECPERTAPALSVDLDRELFYCHRCQWHGGRRTLEKELGIVAEKPTPAEVHHRRIVRHEAEEFTGWARRKRIGLAALLRTLDRAEAEARESGLAQLASGNPVDEGVWAKLGVIIPWQGRAEQGWRRLCEVEINAPELYAEFTAQRRRHEQL